MVLPQDQLLTTIEHQLSIWNKELTLQECRDCLRLLALAGLPRAAIDEGDADQVQELYWRMFVKVGVTFLMLKSACEALIIAKIPKGQTKFYPDPGGLITLCADDLSEKAIKTGALNKARQRLLELNGGAPQETGPLVKPGKLRSVGEILAQHGKVNPLWGC